MQQKFIELYKKMKTYRVFEETMAALYSKGEIGGFCHLYSGQEAVLVGVTDNMQPQDSVITSYRGHVHTLSFGASIESVTAELCGRSTGCSKGKGGSMHMYSSDRNFYGGNGIVGAQVSLGTGLAFAHKYRKDNGVSVIYFGDGAANQGQVYESFNMAALWGLPAVYVIEDNRYAMGTSVCRSTVDGSLEKRGDPFGIRTISVDGMSLFDVMEKSKVAIEYSRTNMKPSILYVNTYRYRGHSMSDPGTYRTKEEVSSMKAKDPIEQLKMYLLDQCKMSDKDIDAIDHDVSDVVNVGVQKALVAGYPSESELMTDIYCN